MQNYEESVSFLGTWGPFQRRVLSLICLSSIPSGYILLSPIFLLASPPHHCHIPTHSNLSQDWIQASIPVQHEAGGSKRSSCSRYELDLLQNLSAVENIHIQNLSVLELEVLLSQLKQEDCRDGWTYSNEYFESTLVTEFNLVCGDQWKQPLASLVFFLGGLCGSFISGQVADRIGRKPVLFGTITLISVFSTAVAFAPSWPVFTLLFFMLGLGQITSYVVAFVLGSEILTGSTRFLFSNLCLPFVAVISMLLLPSTASLVRNWRHLTLLMAVPGVFCIPLWWLIPESPRWLVSRGRLREAELLLRSAAVENRVEPPQVIFLSTKDEKTSTQKAESYNFLDLLRHTNIRRIILILWLIWFSMNISVFGLSFNLSSLSGNPFLNYILFSAVELPAYGSSWLAALNFPRRMSIISFTLLGAVALFFIQVTPHSLPTLTLALVLLGKYGILAGIGVLYMFTSELSPTVIRNTAMSSCAMFSRAGSSLSPYLLQLAVFSPYLPWIVAGSLSLLSLVLCVFLPETFRQPLPDTIQQMKPPRGIRLPGTCISPAKDDGKSTGNQTSAPEIICTAQL